MVLRKHTTRRAGVYDTTSNQDHRPPPSWARGIGTGRSSAPAMSQHAGAIFCFLCFFFIDDLMMAHPGPAGFEASTTSPTKTSSTAPAFMGTVGLDGRSAGLRPEGVGTRRPRHGDWRHVNTRSLEVTTSPPTRSRAAAGLGPGRIGIAVGGFGRPCSDPHTKSAMGRPVRLAQTRLARRGAGFGRGRAAQAEAEMSSRSRQGEQLARQPLAAAVRRARVRRAGLGAIIVVKLVPPGGHSRNYASPGGAPAPARAGGRAGAVVGGG